MKNNLSVFLSLAMILSIVPMTALAAEIDSYNGIKQHVSDLLAEVQRLRAENEYLKNLQALVWEDERRQRRKRR